MKRLSAFLFGEKKEYAFHSDLSVDECLAKLKGSVRKKQSWIESGSTADPAKVIGYFKGTNFQLIKKINYRNSFQPIFYGKLKIGNTGTVISGHFDIHPAVKAFISFMIAWVFFFILIVIVPKYNAGLLLSSVVVIIGIIAIWLVGGFLGSPAEIELLNFIQTTLEATLVKPDKTTKEVSNKTNR